MRLQVAVLLPALASALIPGTQHEWRDGEKSSNLRASVQGQGWRGGHRSSTSVSSSNLVTTSSPQKCLDEDLADLVYLRAQLREVQNLISEKKRSISAKDGHYRDTIADCDDLRCVGRVMTGTTSNTWNRKPSGRYGHPKIPACRSSKNGRLPPSTPNTPNTLLPVCRYPEPVAHRPQAPYTRPSQGQSYNQCPRPRVIYQYRHERPAITVFKYLGLCLLGFICAHFLFVIRRRIRDPKWATRRAERIQACLARRAERRNRRAARRAAFKKSINDFLCRVGCKKSSEQHERDEKCDSLLDSNNEAATSTMEDDISEFRSVSDIVSDLVAVEEGRSKASSRSNGSLFELGSQNGDEQLPAYDDHDASDANSSVPDGFMYTPGSTEYAPSSTGDASDILGSDKD